MQQEHVPKHQRQRRLFDLPQPLLIVQVRALRLEEVPYSLGDLGQRDPDEPVLQALAQLVTEVLGLRDPLCQPSTFPQRVRSEQAQVEPIFLTQLRGVDFQVLPRRRADGRPALEQPVPAGGLQDAPLHTVLLAVGQHQPFRQRLVFRETAELRRVPVGMHHCHRGPLMAQQVAAFGELVHLVSHALEQGTPLDVAGRWSFPQGGGEPRGVDGPPQPLPSKMGGEQVLDLQSRDNRILQPAEFPGQKRSGLAGRHGGGCLQQIKYPPRGQLPNGDGRPGAQPPEHCPCSPPGPAGLPNRPGAPFCPPTACESRSRWPPRRTK